jgi:hypothetical protein
MVLPANIITIPFVRLKVAFMQNKIGMVANWEAPLMIPFKNMLGNSLSNSSAGAYNKNMRTNILRLSLIKSALREAYLNISTKVKNSLFSLFLMLSWY